MNAVKTYKASIVEEVAAGKNNKRVIARVSGKKVSVIVPNKVKNDFEVHVTLDGNIKFGPAPERTAKLIKKHDYESKVAVNF